MIIVEEKTLICPWNRIMDVPFLLFLTHAVYDIAYTNNESQSTQSYSHVQRTMVLLEYRTICHVNSPQSPGHSGPVRLQLCPGRLTDTKEDL